MSYLSILSRCAYILGDGQLFDELIAHLLTLDADLRVIRRVYESDAEFLDDLSLHQPDVIVLSESRLFEFEQILVLLSGISRTISLRVIRVGMNDNDIALYDLPPRSGYRWTAIPPVHISITNSSELIDLVGGREATA